MQWLTALLALMALTKQDEGERVLASCPDSPNCVSTQARSKRHGMPPLVYDASEERVMSAVRKALVELPRTRIVEDRGTYVRAEARSRLFRFADDIEVLLDTEHRRLHFRSASRSGYWDLGANRRRMTAFSEALAGVDGIRVAED